MRGHVRRRAGGGLPALGVPPRSSSARSSSPENRSPHRPRPAREARRGRAARPDRLDRRLPRDRSCVKHRAGGDRPARTRWSAQLPRGGRPAATARPQAALRLADALRRRGAAMNVPRASSRRGRPDALRRRRRAAWCCSSRCSSRAARPSSAGRSRADWLGSAAGAASSALFLGLAVLRRVRSVPRGQLASLQPGAPARRLDRFANFVDRARSRSASLLSCCCSRSRTSPSSRINHGEYYALMLISTRGHDAARSRPSTWCMVFLGIEIMSIPIYVLAGFDRRKLRSNESALKYFLIGSFASAILLYGDGARSTAPPATSTSTASAPASMPATRSRSSASASCSSASPSRSSSVPFHQWAPDVYEGAPTAGHRLHVGHREGSRPSRALLRVLTRPSARCRPRLSAAALGARRADDGRRQRDGA